METLGQVGEWIGAVLGTLGAVAIVASLAASVANGWVRTLAEQGVTIPRWVLIVVAILNVLAANLDKAGQLARGYRGPSRTAGETRAR
ncbi:MAG: hypothetical protein Q8Q14_10745 [Gemmatimonadales bacterium]|nr:hypothetical protein [Gemmatimonadales bacterium]